MPFTLLIISTVVLADKHINKVFKYKSTSKVNSILFLCNICESFILIDLNE